MRTINQLLNVVKTFAKTLKIDRDIVCIVRNVDE